MDTVELLPADPDGADHRRCLDLYYRELDQRFEGGFDASVKAYSGNGKPNTKTCTVLAWRGAEPVGCGSLIWGDGGIGEIKRMWVAPQARGLGIARRILAHLEGEARAAGLTAVRLDTNRVLAEAHALYRAAGYREIARYSDNPYAHDWFGKTLTED